MTATNLSDKRAIAAQKISGVTGIANRTIVKPGTVKPNVVSVAPTQINTTQTTQKQQTSNVTNNTVESTSTTKSPVASNVAVVSYANVPQKELEKRALAIAGKLKTITQEMKTLFVERDNIIDSMMVALIAGQHVLLLGPPGTGKSLLASEFFKRIDDSKFFSHLLNRTSDPSEIVGPISIKSMEQDKFVRILDGKLGDCDIAFLDEVYKSNEPTLNIMLSALNERVIYNDGKAVPIPLKMMVAASNEMPAEGEGLEALHDRILVKHWVDYIQDASNRMIMLKNYNDSKNPYNLQQIPRTTITLEELQAIQYYKDAVSLSKGAITSYNKLLNELGKKKIVISDRKVNWCLDILKGSALLNGRTTVYDDDIKALAPVLWEKQEDIAIVTQCINKLVDPFTDKVNGWYEEASSILNDIKAVDGKDDPESRRQFAELTVEGKTKIDVILSKMTDTINSAANKGKNVERMNQLKDKIQNDLTAILNKMLNITPSSMSQQPTMSSNADYTPLGFDQFEDIQAPF